MGFFDKWFPSKTVADSEVQHSNYWLGGRPLSNINLSDKGGDLETAARLASIKKAITNFVRIVTGKEYPVKFSSGNDSYTDGKTVIISADTNEKHFDAVVGVALHESSHLLLTDFNILQDFSSQTIAAQMIPSDLLTKAHKLGYAVDKVQFHLKDLMNVIEDRRIDYFLYRTAPGYRPYYEALYNHYFNNEQIDLALEYGLKWTDPIVENYILQILNSVNRHFNPKVLPGLSDIMKMLDWNTINRLDDDKEAYNYSHRQTVTGTGKYDIRKMPKLFQLAVATYSDILDNVLKNMQADAQKQELKSEQQCQGGSGEGEPQEQDGDSDKEDNHDIPSGDTKVETKSGKSSKSGDKEDKQDEDKDTESKQAGSKKVEGKPEPKKGTPKEFNEQKFDAAAKKQKDFLEGKLQKQTISKEMETQVNALDSAGATLTEAGEGAWGRNQKVPVVVLKKLTKDIIQGGNYPFAHYGASAGRGNRNSEAAVKNGLRMGAILASRVMVRNQDRETKFTRQEHGKIDRRLVAALGHDMENVFYQSRLDQFKPVHVHMTLDASGSMDGMKWQQALTVAVAIAYASEKIRNINVVISLRAAISGPAVIAIVYDSRIDKFTKVRSLFKYLAPTSSTPEGLTFEAIMNILTENIKNTRKYFINLSDGEPAFGYHDPSNRNSNGLNYSGDSAAKHTRDQVNRIRDAGVRILSYFISESGSYQSSTSKRLFKIMYGQDASFIDVNSIPKIVSTLNKLFMESGD